MKSFLILIILSFLASCGNNKLRLKKVSLFNKQEIVSLDEKQKLEKNQNITNTNTETSSLTPLVLEEEHSNTEVAPLDETSEEKELKSVERINGNAISIAPSDTLKSGENLTEEAKATAQKAENISAVAVWLSFGALLILLMSVVFALLLMAWEPLLAGAIVGFIMSLNAVILGFVSKGKSHNTELGRRQSSKAIIGGFALTFVLGLVLLLVA